MINHTAIVVGMRFITSTTMLTSQISVEKRCIHRLLTRLKHFTIIGGRDGRFREKYHVVTRPRPAKVATDSAHSTLSRIPPHSVAQLFARNKSNTTAKVVLRDPYLILMNPLSYDKRKIRRLKTPSRGEEVGYFRAGFYGIQQDAPMLDAKTLATLCTTSSEHGAAALGGHTSAETMALCALAVVRLISTLHCIFPFILKE